MFLVGVTVVMGPSKTKRFLFQQRHLRGTICFLSGIVIVLCGWTFVGMIIELFGFVNLFGYASSSHD